MTSLFHNFFIEFLAGFRYLEPMSAAAPPLSASSSRKDRELIPNMELSDISSNSRLRYDAIFYE